MISSASYRYIKLKYHMVCIARYRRKILVTGLKSYLKIKLQEIRRYYPDWKYIKIGIKQDHCGKGYFVSTVGINQELIRRDVQSQEEEETEQAKLEFSTHHACKDVGMD
jgi:REP element-mobilizing transposase RayT